MKGNMFRVLRWSAVGGRILLNFFNVEGMNEYLEKTKKYALYTDGGSRGNPGPSGAGYVIYDENNKELYCGKKFLGTATNNTAEYAALLLGLEFSRQLRIKNIDCFLDSDLIVKQLNGVYRVKHPNIVPLFEKVKNALQSFEHISFTHVRREKNKRADGLANEAMDRK
jgi:ribonuclease HI